MNVAIIDVGSARLKVTISVGSKDNNKILKFKEETHLADYLNDNVINEGFISTAFSDTLRKVKTIIEEHNCQKTVVIATHVFRTALNSGKVLSLLEPVIGNVNIIPSWVEGALFYTYMKQHFKNIEIATVDIGGGSVQISFGAREADVFSIDTGTFSLEKKFQKSDEFCSMDELEAMNEMIKKQLSSIKMRDSSLIIMGSNCMLDFLNSALFEMKVLNKDSKLIEGSIIPISYLDSLLNELKTKKYIDLAKFYPGNPYFMFGADKAILNILEISKIFNVTRIAPTNESTSSALLKILQTNTNLLNEYRIKVNDI